MASRDLDDAASRRDLPAVVDAVGERLALPEEPRGLLAVCARAVVLQTRVGVEDAPAVVRVVLEAVVRAARSCTACGEVHLPRKVTPYGGGQPLMTWQAPDGHHYLEASNRGAYWLNQALQEGA